MVEHQDTTGNFNRKGHIYTKSRVYQRSTRKAVHNPASNMPRQTHTSHMTNYTIPTTNMFSELSTREGKSIIDKERSDTRRHKAPSPLDADKVLKKYRENQSSLSEDSDFQTSFIQVENSPQCDTPANQYRTLSQQPQLFININETPNSLPLNNGPTMIKKTYIVSESTENYSSNEA